MCPIPPGGSFTYSFIADLYGSSWYHSHYSAQYAGGLVGPMIIHGPDTVKYDIGKKSYEVTSELELIWRIDKGPILLTDWFHRDYNDIVEDVVGTDVNKIVS